MTKKPSSSFISLQTVVAEKATMKQLVYRNTKKVFNDMVQVVAEVISELRRSLPNLDPNIPLDYRIQNDFELEIIIAGDVLIFHMHSNVFQFDKSHGMWKTSYIQDDDTRSYCGIIYVYNFLKDSFIYDRKNDVGYLIARLFVNKENHYFLEGKRQMGFLYNDFSNAVIDRDELRKVIESLLLYALDFDLFVPSYDAMKELSIYEMEEISKNMPLKTGKRLGFKFQADSDELIV